MLGWYSLWIVKNKCVCRIAWQNDTMKTCWWNFNYNVKKYIRILWNAMKYIDTYYKHIEVHHKYTINTFNYIQIYYKYIQNIEIHHKYIYTHSNIIWIHSNVFKYTMNTFQYIQINYRYYKNTQILSNPLKYIGIYNKYIISSFEIHWNIP
jgi:hypothetical protein